MLGIFDGYTSVAEDSKKIEFLYFQILSSNTEMDDVSYYKNKRGRPNFKNMTIDELLTYTALHTHCSSLVKAANDLSDIWFGHNTWTSYGIMIRTFKEYRFVTNKQTEKSKSVVFCSYPGALSSADDFYYMDTKLLVQETTNGNYNESLYDLLSPETLFTWVRAILANRLASTSEEWIEIFKRENSGTCNNQFQVSDINKVDFETKTFEKNALMIVEPLPGYTESADITHFLRRGYWPSFNIPYFKNIYEMSGFKALVDDKPELYYSYDYSGSNRPKIFRREFSKVNSLEDFKKILRFNKYEEDEFSQKNAAWTIASRYDLNTKGVGRPLCYGAVDVKAVSVKDLKEGKNIIHIISGPTNDDQPSFSWSNTTCDAADKNKWYHEDVAETWNFPWIEYQVQLFDN